VLSAIGGPLDAKSASDEAIGARKSRTGARASKQSWPDDHVAGGAFGALLKNAATCGNLAYVPFPELMKTRAAAK
jgi:hypothetical protein